MNTVYIFAEKNEVSLVRSKLFIQIAESPTLLEHLAHFLHKHNEINQPLSLESKILLLYDFCKSFTPDKTLLVSEFWIENGLSLKKDPAQLLKTWNQNSRIKNPFSEIVNDETLYTKDGNRFYYFVKGDETVLFWFNQSLKRSGSYKKTITKNEIF